MTENDKAELLEMLNKAAENYKNEISAEAESRWRNLIDKLINIAETRGYKIIWEGYKAVKIVEKEDKEDDKRWNFRKNTG